MRAWEEIQRTNKVAKALAAMELRADEVAHGSKRAAYLYGPSGVGKSFTIRHATTLLKLKGLDQVECAPRNYGDLLAHFEMTEGERPLVLEEADVIWRSERMLNILKIATDRIREPHERVYRGVALTAPILVTTNVDLSDRSQWSPVLRTHGPALFRRDRPRGVPFERPALCEYSVALAIYKRLIDKQIIEDGPRMRHSQTRPASRRAAAIKWFVEQQDNLDIVSPGTLESVAEAYDYDDEIVRESDLIALLVPERQRRPIRPSSVDWEQVIKGGSSAEA